MNLNVDTILLYLSYINSSHLQAVLLPLKIFSILVSLFFIVAIIIILIKTHYLDLVFFQSWNDFFNYNVTRSKKRVKVWTEVKKRLEGGQESEYKLAILEADGMLDDVLKKMGYIGDTLDERLDKLNSEIIPNLEQLKEARRTRDDILHDPDFRLNQERSQKVIETYEQALKYLEAI